MEATEKRRLDIAAKQQATIDAKKGPRVINNLYFAVISNNYFWYFIR